MTATPAGGERLPWRRLATSVLLPTGLAYLAQGAVLPALVLTAQRFGASPSTAAAVAALVGVGQLGGSVPAGVLAARYGDRRVLVGASLVVCACWSIAFAASTVPVLGAVALLAGAGAAAFNVARQSHVVDVVPPAFRARAMSTLGGVGRVGLLVGPLLAAAAQVPLGARGAYLVGAGAGALAGLAAWLGERGHPLSTGTAAPAGPTRRPSSLVAVARSNARLLATLGLAAAVIASARSLRPVLVPLWAVQVGLSAQAVSLLFALTAAVELALSYPAGSVMDRWGRAWVAVPCAALMGLGILVLPLAASVPGLVAGAVVLGLGSGLGSGVVKTLGADAAPREDRSAFLGLWVLVTDVGSSGGPLVAAGLTAALSLAAASTSLGLVTLVGAGWLAHLLRGSARPAPR